MGQLHPDKFTPRSGNPVMPRQTSRSIASRRLGGGGMDNAESSKSDLVGDFEQVAFPVDREPLYT
jgi:hypothetical protein